MLDHARAPPSVSLLRSLAESDTADKNICRTKRLDLFSWQQMAPVTDRQMMDRRIMKSQASDFQTLESQFLQHQVPRRALVDLKAVAWELQQARRARIAAQNAGRALESLIVCIQRGFSLREIELGLAAPSAH